MSRRRVLSGGRYLALALAVLVALFPFWWMLVT